MADCRGRKVVLGGLGEPRFAVMTAVLREAGLNQYPDIERVSDTLTIPDPGCCTSALLAPERKAEMASARRLITIDVRISASLM